jgi:glycosyltransferase involved in cell wall biosynthesis
MKKILIVTNVPNPYRIALFNELNRQLRERGMELQVVFGAEGYARRLNKTDLGNATFHHRILDGGVYTSQENTERTFFGYSGLSAVLDELQPYRTIIIGFSAGTLRLFLRSFYKNEQYIIWAGSLKKEGRNDNIARIISRKLLMKRASAFIAYGSKAKEYLVSMGASPERVSIAMNTSDPAFFLAETDKIRQEGMATMGDGKKHLLYIGYLVRRKNVGLLIECMAELRKHRNDFILDIVGDGESREQLEKQASELNLSEHVKFHGFRQKSELPAFLAQSSVFLFQTDFDVWGLTVNEAMAAGLPVLSSIHAGATFDLIEEGVTGYAVDFRQRSKISALLQPLLDHPERCKEMGMKARERLLAKASLEKSASGFIDAIEKSATKN